MARCFWCNTNPDEAAASFEGPHATWCPQLITMPRNPLKVIHFKIRECRECPHFRREGYATLCNIDSSNRKRSVGPGQGGVPDWCPLPN